MAANVFCDCGQDASKYCFCLKPAKTFLCDRCIGVHCIKSVAHVLFPVENEDIFDVELLTFRNDAVIAATAEAERMKQALLTEQGTVPGLVDQMYQKRCSELCVQYAQVQSDLVAVYEETCREIDKVVEQLQSLKRKMHVPVTGEMVGVLGLSWHERQRMDTFIDVSAVLTSGRVECRAKDILAKGFCREEKCHLCTDNFNKLRLGQPREGDSMSSASHSRQPIHEENPGFPAWRCPGEGCGRLYTRPHFECQCGYRSQSFEEMRSHQPAKAPPSIHDKGASHVPVSRPNAQYAHMPELSICAHCGFAKKEGETCMCWECNVCLKQNTGSVCTQCQLPQPFCRVCDKQKAYNERFCPDCFRDVHHSVSSSDK